MENKAVLSVVLNSSKSFLNLTMVLGMEMQELADRKRDMAGSRINHKSKDYLKDLPTRGNMFKHWTQVGLIQS